MLYSFYTQQQEEGSDGVLRESIHKYFSVGLVAFMAYPELMRGDSPRTLERLWKIAGDDYFDAVEVNWIKDPLMRKKAAALLESSHIQVCYGAQPRLLTTGLSPNDLDEERRLAAERTLLEAIDEARELGSGSVAFLSGPYEEKSREESFSQLLKTTGSLCRYAGEKGMGVELEVFDYDIAKKALIGPAPLAARFAAKVRERYDNFGLLIDLSHLPMTRETSSFAVRCLRPYLTHFHVGNTVIASPELPGFGDEHPRFGFPGGENDLPELLEFLRVLKREGFFDAASPYVLSFEVKPWGDEDPELVVAGAKRTLRRAWALLEED